MEPTCLNIIYIRVCVFDTCGFHNNILLKSNKVKKLQESNLYIILQKVTFLFRFRPFCEHEIYYQTGNWNYCNIIFIHHEYSLSRRLLLVNINRT